MREIRQPMSVETLLHSWYKKQRIIIVVALPNPISIFKQKIYRVRFPTQLTAPQTNLWTSSYTRNKSTNTKTRLWHSPAVSAVTGLVSSRRPIHKLRVTRPGRVWWQRSCPVQLQNPFIHLFTGFSLLDLISSTLNHPNSVFNIF